MEGFQKAVIAGTVEDYVEEFLRNWFRDDKEIPEFVKIGVELAGFDKIKFDK